MRPAIPADLLDRAADWDELHRWERSELGRALRRLGLTYGEIRDLIPYWCREIRLSDEQIEAIRDRTAARTYWREAVGLRAAKFTKTFIKPAGNGASKEPASTRCVPRPGEEPIGSLEQDDGMDRGCGARLGT